MAAYTQLIKRVQNNVTTDHVAQDVIIWQTVDQISSEMELHYVDISWIQLYEGNEDDRVMIMVVNSAWLDVQLITLRALTGKLHTRGTQGKTNLSRRPLNGNKYFWTLTTRVLLAQAKYTENCTA